MRRVAGSLGVALIWAAVWAAAGALIGIAGSRGSTEELWLGPPIGLFPGFVAGVMFAVLHGVAVGGRRLAELSIPKAAAGGALAGLVVGTLPFVINKPASEAPLWLIGAVVIGSMTLLGAVSAAASVALARGASRLRPPRSA